MMSIPLTYHPADLLVFLAEPALRSLVLGCIAALVVAMLRKKRAAARLRISSFGGLAVSQEHGSLCTLS